MPFNNDANDKRQTNTLKNAQIKHPQKVCLSYININSIINKVATLFEFTYMALLIFFQSVRQN